MSTGSIRVRKKKSPENPKPLGWSDLDQLGLPRDHFYRSFIELDRRLCPRCGCDHIHMRYINYGVNHRGWEWRCDQCLQIWREPRITPGLRAQHQAEKKPQVRVEMGRRSVQEIQDYGTETIISHKYF